MIVRIRFGRGAKVDKHGRNGHKLALGLAALLTPAAVLATVLGLWRIAADLNWTGSFAIPTGLFSHWQVWLGMAVLLQLGARLLNRYGKSEDTAAS
jgi:hypothetical protein